MMKGLRRVVIPVRRMKWLGKIGLLLLFVQVAFLGSSCDDSSGVFPYISGPYNIRLSIDGDSATTRDTLLRVSISGENVNEMLVSADSTLIDAAWEPFDTLKIFSVPHIEGNVAIYGQFNSIDGGTTEVIRDDIQLDFQARIQHVDVSSNQNVLWPGDIVQFTLDALEEGVAHVSFGNVIRRHRLDYDGDGIFSSSLTIMHGIGEENVQPVGFFTDMAGNTAEPKRVARVFTIEGLSLNPRVIGWTETEWITAHQIWYSGGYCYLTEEFCVHVVSVEELTVPRWNHRIETGSWTFGIAGYAQTLLVANDQCGVIKVNIESPNDATVIDHTVISGKPKDVAVDYPWVNVVCVFEGLKVFEIGLDNDIRQRSQLSVTTTGEY
ncbi:MAG: hypothetical protein P9M15_06565, partial [Candidatus Electryoneaceae bacterium]|nr:hypothetical protein [Candidatus Electryoneaceae bacterium]